MYLYRNRYMRDYSESQTTYFLQLLMWVIMAVWGHFPFLALTKWPSSPLLLPWRRVTAPSHLRADVTRHTPPIHVLRSPRVPWEPRLLTSLMNGAWAWSLSVFVVLLVFCSRASEPNGCNKPQSHRCHKFWTLLKSETGRVLVWKALVGKRVGSSWLWNK